MKNKNTLGDPRAVEVYFPVPCRFTTVTGQHIIISAGSYDVVLEQQNEDTSTVTFEEGSKVTEVMNSTFRLAQLVQGKN